jgi:hypothetical protein
MPLPISSVGHKPKMDIHGIKADLLIPGRGDPMKNGVVIVEGKKIAYTGCEKSLPDEYKSIAVVYVPSIMPGLWDCYLHCFGFGNEYSLDAAARVPLTGGCQRRPRRSCYSSSRVYVSQRACWIWSGSLQSYCRGYFSWSQHIFILLCYQPNWSSRRRT